MLYLWANIHKVSPDLMVYSNEPTGHLVGGGVVPPGMHITWPICKYLDLFLVILIIASTVVLYLCAYPWVSPDLMV